MDQIVELTGARVAFDSVRSQQVSLRIQKGRILPFEKRVEPDIRLDLSGYMILPGLINAHDHLEFGLFPRLGSGPWPNAREWAEAVHHPDSSPVREHRAVPRTVRLFWGAIRNVICGVTTVAHHNPFESVFRGKNFPVRVVRRLGWAHSLDFSPDIIDRRLRTPRAWPFVIHAAEGTDARAAQEICRLDEMGILSERTVIVHATAATPAQLARMRARLTSIIWCPSSNLFSVGRTLAAETVRSFPFTSLGTDSSLTADGDLIDEIRVARRRIDLSSTEVYRLVTTNPACALRLISGEGSICEGGYADLIAVRDKGQTPAEALDDLPPDLVLKGGRPVLMSNRFAATSQWAIPSGLHAIEVEGRGLFFIAAPLPRLHAVATIPLGRDIRLAGKRVLV
jgi:cytosine/adenosine deaminase-related metal-dependent hydrolase